MTTTKRKRSTFKKQNRQNPWAGILGNRCMCKKCRGSVMI